MTEKEVDEVLNTIAPNEVTLKDTKIVDDAVKKLLDPNRVITDCDDCKSSIRADAIDELRDAIIEEVKAWYWDREMQDYHPDCDLFVNYFIDTTKAKSQLLKERQNE